MLSCSECQLSGCPRVGCNCFGYSLPERGGHESMPVGVFHMWACLSRHCRCLIAAAPQCLQIGKFWQDAVPLYSRLSGGDQVDKDVDVAALKDRPLLKECMAERYPKAALRLRWRKRDKKRPFGAKSAKKSTGSLPHTTSLSTHTRNSVSSSPFVETRASSWSRRSVDVSTALKRAKMLSLR